MIEISLNRDYKQYYTAWFSKSSDLTNCHGYQYLLSQMNIWSASDYAIKVGEGDCERVEVTTNSLQCIPPEEKPPAGPADHRGGSLPVLVSRSSSPPSFIFLPTDETISIGNHGDHIGYLKYDLDDDIIPAVMWAVISVGPAILLIATVTVCILWKRSIWQCLGSKTRKRFHETVNNLEDTPRKTHIGMQPNHPAPVNDPSTNPDRAPLDQLHSLDGYLRPVQSDLFIFGSDDQGFFDNSTTFAGIKDPSKYTWNGAIRNQKVEGQPFGNPAFEWVSLDSDDVQGGTHGYTSRHHDSDVRAPFYHRKRETLDPQGNMEMLYHYEDERLVYEEKQGPWEPHTRKEAGADQESNDYQRSRYFLCEKNREEMHPPPDYD